jgi:hypothetical protein
VTLFNCFVLFSNLSSLCASRCQVLWSSFHFRTLTSNPRKANDLRIGELGLDQEAISSELSICMLRVRMKWNLTTCTNSSSCKGRLSMSLSSFLIHFPIEDKIPSMSTQQNEWGILLYSEHDFMQNSNLKPNSTSSLDFARANAWILRFEETGRQPLSWLYLTLLQRFLR